MVVPPVIVPPAHDPVPPGFKYSDQLEAGKDEVLLGTGISFLSLFLDLPASSFQLVHRLMRAEWLGLGFYNLTVRRACL